MSLSDFLIDATRATFVLLGLVTTYEYLRARQPARLDVALFFGSLAYVLGVQEIFILTGLRPEWVVKSIQLATLAHSYLLLRVLANLQPIRRRLMQAALAGLVLAGALWLVYVVPPLLVNVASVGYMAVVDSYAVVVLVRGALLTRGVTRQRLRFAALGAGLLAAALLVLVADVLLPGLARLSSNLILALAVCSGLAFYVGFAAPRRVRRLWQLSELESFLNASQAAPAEEPVSAALARLCQAAVRAVGGETALVAARPGALAGWSVTAATDQPAAAEHPLAADWLALWPAGWAQLAAAGAPPAGPGPTGRTLLLVPIAGPAPRQQVLAVVLARRPLFPEDDQALLQLMCRHSALLLSQKRLIEQLREQNDELVQANQELEAFAYSVSHDLRTPLRHIQGFAEALRDDPAAAAAPQYLKHILGATGRMGHLIDVFLSFSRLGRAELAQTRVPLAALVAQVKDELELEARGRAVHWRIGPLPDVLGDPVLLRQAWLNVVGNALKYTRTRPAAEIEIGTLPGASGSVTVFVRDNGVGFDPAFASQLFTVFGRLHHASEFEGDGLGLAVVRRIVQRHHGRVWAEGRPEGGATIFMMLRPAEKNILYADYADQADKAGQAVKVQANSGGAETMAERPDAKGGAALSSNTNGRKGAAGRPNPPSPFP